MMGKYYKILNLEITATLVEVKEKYNQLIEEFNPEKQEDDLKDFFIGEQNKIKEAYRNILENIIKSKEEDKKDDGLEDENEGEVHDLGVYQGSEETKFCKFCGHMQLVTNSECVNCRESLFPINNGNVVSNHVVRSENQKGMFTSPFSFNGRIRRLEYSISFIIFVVVFGFMINLFDVWGFEGGAAILLLPVFWFIIAQGSKRCHDMSLSGWMQLIPYFNPLALIFASGKIGDNKYGSNPKGLNYN